MSSARPVSDHTRESSANWVRVTDLDSLIAKGRKVVKAEGKQIALFHVAGRTVEDGGIQACNNRCPHEGYPLIEGVLSGGADGAACKLTCNWHNWKFDLDSGETEIGGDKLRRYPVRVEGGAVLVDITDPAPEELIRTALDNIADAMPRHEYDRIAREVARMVLPVTIYSSAYVTMNARALMNFLSLRKKSDDATYPSYPQREIEMVAEAYEEHFARLMPITHEAFVASGRVAP